MTCAEGPNLSHKMFQVLQFLELIFVHNYIEETWCGLICIYIWNCKRGRIEGEKQGRHQAQQTGVWIRAGIWGVSPVSGGLAPSPEKNDIFFLNSRTAYGFGAFWANRCGDCLDITAYSSGVFILLQTDFTIETAWLTCTHSYLKFYSRVYHRPIH